MLEVQNLSKSFNGEPALRDISLTVPRRVITALIGPSGCGKSTLLRTLIGLLFPDRGTVLFDGEPLSERTVLRIRHRTGYVIQEGGLFPHLTAERNIRLLADRLGRSRRETGERVHELCAITRFPAGALARYPYELSGGQRQRVALMRALLLDPDVLLLDEPLAALDPIVRSSLQQELKQTIERLGKTTVLVTHDLAEAAWFSRDIVLMRAGRIVQRGPISQLRERPAAPFVTEFVRAQRGPHESD